MSTIDVNELVNSWLISQWLERSQWEWWAERSDNTSFDVEVHGPASLLSVETADAGWECGCWSSWTRDDDFVMEAKIRTAAGVVTFKYGSWADFPSFIEELDIYRQSSCPYDR
ncbi:hypothetical protein ACWDX6_24095 [Streptomyces sp. NPDC003027]